MIRLPPGFTLFPYTTLFGSRIRVLARSRRVPLPARGSRASALRGGRAARAQARHVTRSRVIRSEEHTSELQSHSDIVCRLLLEKKTRHVRWHPWRYRICGRL